MADVVVTVPAKLWGFWCAEGDLPGEGWTGRYYEFRIPTVPVALEREASWATARVYVAALGKLRGFAPLARVDVRRDGVYLIRAGGAEAVTIDQPVRGFQGYRYRWWDRAAERPFPEWRAP